MQKIFSVSNGASRLLGGGICASKSGEQQKSSKKLQEDISLFEDIDISDNIYDRIQGLIKEIKDHINKVDDINSKKIVSNCVRNFQNLEIQIFQLSHDQKQRKKSIDLFQSILTDIVQSIDVASRTHQGFCVELCVIGNNIGRLIFKYYNDKQNRSERLIDQKYKGDILEQIKKTLKYVKNENDELCNIILMELEILEMQIKVLQSESDNQKESDLIIELVSNIISSAVKMTFTPALFTSIMNVSNFAYEKYKKSQSTQLITKLLFLQQLKYVTLIRLNGQKNSSQVLQFLNNVYEGMILVSNEVQIQVEWIKILYSLLSQKPIVKKQAIKGWIMNQQKQFNQLESIWKELKDKKIIDYLDYNDQQASLVGDIDVINQGFRDDGVIEKIHEILISHNLVQENFLKQIQSFQKFDFSMKKIQKQSQGENNSQLKYIQNLLNDDSYQFMNNLIQIIEQLDSNFKEMNEKLQKKYSDEIISNLKQNYQNQLLNMELLEKILFLVFRNNIEIISCLKKKQIEIFKKEFENFIQSAQKQTKKIFENLFNLYIQNHMKTIYLESDSFDKQEKQVQEKTLQQMNKQYVQFMNENNKIKKDLKEIIVNINDNLNEIQNNFNEKTKKDVQETQIEEMNYFNILYIDEILQQIIENQIEMDYFQLGFQLEQLKTHSIDQQAILTDYNQSSSNKTIYLQFDKIIKRMKTTIQYLNYFLQGIAKIIIDRQLQKQESNINSRFIKQSIFGQGQLEKQQTVYVPDDDYQESILDKFDALVKKMLQEYSLKNNILDELKQQTSNCQSMIDNLQEVSDENMLFNQIIKSNLDFLKKIKDQIERIINNSQQNSLDIILEQWNVIWRNLLDKINVNLLQLKQIQQCELERNNYKKNKQNELEDQQFMQYINNIFNQYRQDLGDEIKQQIIFINRIEQNMDIKIFETQYLSNMINLVKNHLANDFNHEIEYREIELDIQLFQNISQISYRINQQNPQKQNLNTEQLNQINQKIKQNQKSINDQLDSFLKKYKDFNLEYERIKSLCIQNLIKNDEYQDSKNLNIKKIQQVKQELFRYFIPYKQISLLNEINDDKVVETGLISANLKKVQNLLKDQNWKVRIQYLFHMLKLEQVGTTKQIIEYAGSQIVQIKALESDQNVRQIFKNKDIIKQTTSTLKQYWSSQENMISLEVKDIISKINEHQELIKQESQPSKRKEYLNQINILKQDLEIKTNNMQEISSSIGIVIQIIIDLKTEIIHINDQLNKLQNNINEIGIDLKYIRGKTYRELFMLRRKDILYQKTQSDFNSVFVNLRTVEKIDKKMLEESDLFTQISDDSGEINEFLFKEEDKFDSLLIYGIAGSGKSTIAKKIEEFLWEHFDLKKLFPVLIQLPQISNHALDVVQETLKNQFYRFDDRQINDLKQDAKESKVRIVFILDSYDETKLVGQNVAQMNNLQYWGQEGNFKSNARVIITTRNEIFKDQQYRDWFYLTQDSKLKEIEIVQFNELQRQEFLNQYVKLNLKKIVFENYSQNLKKNVQKNIIDLQQYIWKQIDKLDINYESVDKLVDDQTQQQIEQLIISNENIITFDKHALEELRIQMHNIWTQQKFQNLIKQLGLQQILNTPFIMEIVTQVLPSMIEKQSDMIKVKKRFLKQFDKEKDELFNKNKIIIDCHKTQIEFNNKNNLNNINQSFIIQQNDNNDFQNDNLDKNNIKVVLLQLMEENQFLSSCNNDYIWNILDQYKIFNNYSLANSEEQIQQKIQKISIYEFIDNQYEFKNDQPFIEMNDKTKNNIIRLILNSLQKNQSKIFDFYKEFLNFYFKKEIKKLMSSAKNEINFDTIYLDFKKFTIDLALKMTQKTLTVVNYKPQGQYEQSIRQKKTWQDKFFEENQTKLGKLKKHIKAGIPLKRKGNSYSFIHKSIQEFCVASDIINTIKNYCKALQNNNYELFELQKLVLNLNFNQIYHLEQDELMTTNYGMLNILFETKLTEQTKYVDQNQKDEIYSGLLSQIFILTQEIQILQNSYLYRHNINTPFQKGILWQIADYIKSKPQIHLILIQLVQLTKFFGSNYSDAMKDPKAKESMIIGGSNIISILVQADVQFRNQDLQSIILQDAQMLGAVLTGSNLSHSQLNNCNINKVNLDYADLTNANWTNCALSEYPTINFEKVVTSLCLSKDGLFIVTGLRDGWIIISEILSQKVLNRFIKDGTYVSQVWLSDDHQKILSSSQSSIYTWNLKSRKVVDTIQLSRKENISIENFMVSDDEKVILIIIKLGNQQNFKYEVLRWNVNQNILALQQLQQLSKYPLVNLSNDGLRIICVDKQNIIILDSDTGRGIRNIQINDISINALCFSSIKNRIILADQNKQIQIYNSIDGEQFPTLTGHTDYIYNVCVSSNGERILSCGEVSIIIWNITSGQQLMKIYVQSVKKCLTVDGRRIIAIQYNSNKIKIMDFEEIQQQSSELSDLKGHSMKINSICLSPDDQKLVSAGDDKTIRIWNLQTGQQLQVLYGHTLSVKCASISKDGKYIVSGSQDKTIGMWNLKNGRLQFTLQGHDSSVNSVCFSIDGQKIFSGSDSDIRIWDSLGRKQIQLFKDNLQKLMSICISPDETKIIASNQNNWIAIWNLQTGNLIKEKNNTLVSSICISSDGKKILIGKLDDIEVWDLDGNQIDNLKINQQSNSTNHFRIQSVFVSNDGNKIVSGRYDKTITIFDSKNRSQLVQLFGQSPISQVLITHDQTKLITTSSNKITVWDINQYQFNEISESQDQVSININKQKQMKRTITNESQENQNKKDDEKNEKKDG